MTETQVAHSEASVPLGGDKGRAGAVSALVGSMLYGAGVISSGLVGALADGTPAPMGWVIAVAGLGAALCALSVTPVPAD